MVTWIIIGVVAVAALAFIWRGIVIVDQRKVVPYLRFGKYMGELQPGLHWLAPIVNRRLGEFGTQEMVNTSDLKDVQTHDNVRVTLTLTVTRRWPREKMRDIIIGVSDPNGAFWRRVDSAAMEVLASTNLDKALTDRVELGEAIAKRLAEGIAHWGIVILKVQVSAFSIVDTEIERAISMKARAEKEAQAELKRAELQGEISLKLKEAAAHLDEPAWRLKTLETLIELCRSAQNNTILIPTELSQFVAALKSETPPT